MDWELLIVVIIQLFKKTFEKNQLLHKKQSMQILKSKPIIRN